ncbi:MAG: SusC/RagA family TonB-linked outer membrane protein [Saprospiraceae bacterium]|nr:SusC/RagA family TonB-linked outer membrane protein [Saprospiraceae bacterium]
MKFQKPLKVVLFLFFLLAGAIGLQAQSINGQVIDENGDPMPGASVFVDGTSEAAISGPDGRFVINADEGDTMIISFVGYETQRTVIEEGGDYTIQLQIDAESLDDVIVVGYGEAIKKSHLTGSISKVENEQLDQIAVARVDEALIGQVSGVNIAQTEAEAGSAPNITVRGVGTIAGATGPAIVVDGVVVDANFLSNLNMNDIESFEVLKDAASAAIYGSEGANGVIQIVTKSGQDGKTKFSYNGFVGTKEAFGSDAVRKSVADWAAFELAEQGFLSETTQYMQLLVQTTGVDRDWQDVILDGGLITNQSISARGGTKKTKWSTSFSYAEDEGVILTDNFERYTGKIKLDTELSNKLKLGFNLTPSFSTQRRVPSSIHNPLRQNPWLPIYHTEESLQFINRANYPDVGVGDYFFEDHLLSLDLDGDGSSTRPRTSGDGNPFAQLYERDRNEDRVQLVGALKLSYKLMDGLTVRSQLSNQWENRKREQYDGVLYHSRGAERALYNLQDRVRNRLISDNTISYVRSFDQHSFNAVAGGTFSQEDIQQNEFEGTGFSNDLLPNLLGATQISEFAEIGGEKNRVSYYGRVNYAFADKYLATASLRRDASSVFGPDNKWGSFPAFSVGWNIAREDFLADSDIFSDLKLRASWGLTGNDIYNVGNIVENFYPYIALLNPSNAIADGTITSGFAPQNIPNSLLQWEAQREINPGIDFGLLRGAIQGSVDYYNRTSEELLLNNPVSYVTGFADGIENRGEVVNRGFEFELRSKNITKEKFQWQSTVIATTNENELTDFGDSNGQILQDQFGRQSEWINLVGNPISSFYGYVVDSELENQYWTTPFFPINGESRDIIVKDLNGDGIITDADKTILGNPYPELVWSVTNQFQFGPVDMSFMFQGSHGAEVRNVGDQYFSIQWQGNTLTESGQSLALLDGVVSDDSFLQERIHTNDIIQSADFISLRNVNLGLDFGRLGGTLVENLKLSNARIYVTGQNIFYEWSDDYEGFNPEFVESNSRIITAWGSQRGGSPIQRTFSLGLNVDF